MVANFVVTIAMKYFNKRTLIMTSCLGTAVCAVSSGVVTMLLAQGMLSRTAGVV